MGEGSWRGWCHRTRGRLPGQGRASLLDAGDVLRSAAGLRVLARVFSWGQAAPFLSLPHSGALCRPPNGALADSQPGWQAVSHPGACPPASVQRLVSIECFLPKVLGRIRRGALPEARDGGGPSVSGFHFHMFGRPFTLPAGRGWLQERCGALPLLGLCSLGIRDGFYFCDTRLQDCLLALSVLVRPRSTWGTRWAVSVEFYPSHAQSACFPPRLARDGTRAAGWAAVPTVVTKGHWGRC